MTQETDTQKLPDIPVQGKRTKRRFSRRRFLVGGGAFTAAGVFSALGISRLFKTEAKESLPSSDTYCCPYPEEQAPPVSQPNIEESNSAEAKDPFKSKPLTEVDTPPKLDFHSGVNVSERDMNIIKEAAAMSHDFFHKEIGVYIKGTVRYYVENSESLHPETASGFSVTINTGHDGWKNISDMEKKKIVVHGSFHTLQEAMTRKVAGDIGTDGFGSWIITEGGAEYAAYMGIVDSGLMTYEEAKRIAMQKVRTHKLPHISSLNSRTKGAPYAMGFLAIDFLVGDKGLKIIGDYLRNVYEMPWREAFNKTFGMNVEEAYEKFEKEWRVANNV